MTSKQNGDHVDLASWQRVQPDGTRGAAGVGLRLCAAVVLRGANRYVQGVALLVRRSMDLLDFER